MGTDPFSGIYGKGINPIKYEFPPINVGIRHVLCPIQRIS